MGYVLAAALRGALGALALLLGACGAGGGSPAAPGAPSVAERPAAPAAAAPASPTAPSLRQVRINIPALSATSIQYYLARDEGLFARRGIDAEISVISAALGIKAVIAGDFEFTGAVGTTVSAALTEVPVRIVVINVDRPLSWLYGQPSIASLADLKGKTVAVSAPGALDDANSRLVLRAAGIDTDRDLIFINIGTPDQRVGPLLAGAVDAAVLALPGNVLARQAGMNELAFYGERFRSPFAGLATSTQIIQERRDLVKGTVGATDGRRRLLQHPPRGGQGKPAPGARDRARPARRRLRLGEARLELGRHDEHGGDAGQHPCPGTRGGGRPQHRSWCSVRFFAAARGTGRAAEPLVQNQQTCSGLDNPHPVWDEELLGRSARSIPRSAPKPPPWRDARRRPSAAHARLGCGWRGRCRTCETACYRSSSPTRWWGSPWRLGTSPAPPATREIGRYLFDWLRRNEFSPGTVGFVPERSCVFGVLPGRGDGMSLAFNSHMDTAKQKDDVSLRDPGDAVYQQAWLDGDYIMGHGIVNDKGPMAAWMAAANAIRQAGVSLRGDLVLTMVPGEIDQEPVDEFTSTQYLSKEVGARYLITRGVVADCALVAEGTNFGVAWAGAGKACFKVTVYGKTIYIPYLPPREDLTRSPNAIVKMAAVIAGIEQWAARYERDYLEDTPGGLIVPKVNIGALRAGNPSHISTSSETCHLYMDVRLPPHADPLWIRADLRRVLADCGVEGTVELYTYRKAQVAEGIEPLADAVAQAHTVLGMDPPGRASPVYSSMWRTISRSWKRAFRR